MDDSALEASTPPRAQRRVRPRTLVAAAFATAGALGWLTLWLTDREQWQHRPVPFPGLYPVRAALLLGAGAALVFALFVFATRVRRTGLQRVGVAITVAVLTLSALEAAFMFVPRSHDVGYTLAARVWFHYHWHPINSLGYRDAEPVRTAGKRLVAVVGDSFAAGGGVADPRDRFGDVLQQRRPDLQVVNLGRNGADTSDEYHNLQAFPLAPDVVVLQYLLNDVERAAERAGIRMPPFTPYDDVPTAALRQVVRGSYLANYVYWSFPHADGVAYERCLQRALTDERTLQLHRAELQQFVAYARERHVELVAVLFPILLDLPTSRPLMAGIAELFRSQHVPVIDVADLVEDLAPGERVANASDAHASAAVHARVGEALAALLH